MPKTQAQKDAQRKYQQKAPRAMIECKQRYRDKNIEKYLEYGRKSAAKYYLMNRNYQAIETTMGTCIFMLFES
jgi:hypothetical protein